MPSALITWQIDFNDVFWAKQARLFRTCKDERSFVSYLHVDDHDEFDEIDGLESLASSFDELDSLEFLASSFDELDGLEFLDSMVSMN